MKLPIIDFSDYDEAEPETIRTIARDMERALTTLGFMSISNLDVTREQLAEIFTLSEAFFTQAKKPNKNLCIEVPKRILVTRG